MSKFSQFAFYMCLSLPVVSKSLAQWFLTGEACLPRGGRQKISWVQQSLVTPSRWSDDDFSLYKTFPVVFVELGANKSMKNSPKDFLIQSLSTLCSNLFAHTFYC